MNVRKILRFVSVLAIAGIGATVAAAPVAREEDPNAVSLSAYCAEVRRRVVEQIARVLAHRDFQDTVSGTVTLARDDAFFIQGASESLKVIVPDRRLPSSGDVVRVEGDPSLEGGHVVVVARRWRKTGTAPLPPPRAVTGDDLISEDVDSRGEMSGVHGHRIMLEGRALGLSDTGFAMKVDALPITVLVPKVPPFLRDCGATHPKVRVTGVAEQILDQSVLFGRNRYVMGVKLLVAAPDDIVLEPDLEYLANRHDRRVRYAIVAAFVLLGLVVLALVFVFIRQARRQLRTATLMRERKRMADDLHDTIEQHLVGAGMLLQVGQTAAARDILLQAKREMRDIVWGLKNDDLMRLTPEQMIREFARVETSKGICRVEARLKGLPDHLKADAMRDLSLILREIVGNAIKHGQARKAAIASDPLSGGGWVLRVSNDGAPFDAAKAPGADDGHFGLEGMKRRARRLGGELTIDVVNARTVVTLRVRS